MTAIRRGAWLWAVLVGLPVLLSLYIYEGARIGWRIEGRTGSLDVEVTGTSRYHVLLIELPIAVLTLGYAGMVTVIVVQVMRDRWDQSWSALILLALFFWVLFVMVHALGIWDDISP